MKLYRAKDENRYFIADATGQLIEVEPVAEFKAIDEVPAPPKKRATRATKAGAGPERKPRAKKALIMKHYKCMACGEPISSAFDYENLECLSCGSKELAQVKKSAL